MLYICQHDNNLENKNNLKKNEFNTVYFFIDYYIKSFYKVYKKSKYYLCFNLKKKLFLVNRLRFN